MNIFHKLLHEQLHEQIVQTLIKEAIRGKNITYINYPQEFNTKPDVLCVIIQKIIASDSRLYGVKFTLCNDENNQIQFRW
jgi:hypothetical protein